MPVDLQVAFPQVVIPLNRIRFMPRTPGVPVTLDIVGEDFRAVDEVLINDIPSPDVIIVSQTRLIAQLPDTLQKTLSVTNVRVTSKQLTLSKRSLIRFRIGSTPGRSSGIMRLMQLFLKLLFTTPGSDIFAKRSGGGALQNIGETYGADEGKSLISRFVVSVDTTAKQIVALQSRKPKLARDEKLLSARVSSAGFNKSLGAILATIELTSQAGRSATANLEL